VHYKVAILAADGLFESEKAGITTSLDKSGDGSMLFALEIALRLSICPSGSSERMMVA
jgi:hypothetical protein